MTGHAHIPESFIQELLSRIDIVEIINTYVPLRRQGANYTATCPFHTEKTPSFTVSQTKQFYHCFGCGAHGTAIGFLMEYEGIHFVEACENLAARLGLKMPVEIENQTPLRHMQIYGLLEEAGKFFQAELRRSNAASGSTKTMSGPTKIASGQNKTTPGSIQSKSNRAIDYLKSRGITGKTAKIFQVGYAPPEWDSLMKVLSKSYPIKDMMTAGLLIYKKSEKDGHDHYYDRFRDRIMFPIRDRRGRVLGFGGRILDRGTPKYLNSPETPVFNKGNEVYGLYEARHKNRHLSNLIVVEGYLDVLCLSQFGIENVVATLGTAVTEKHLELLFRQVPELYFCFDGDKAGRAAAKRAFLTSLPHMKEGRRVKFVFLPNGEDPDSFVRRQGKVAFLDLLAHANSLSDYLFEIAAENLDLNKIEDRALLVSKARPLIFKLPKGVLQQMMFERLTELSGLAGPGKQGGGGNSGHGGSNRSGRGGASGGGATGAQGYLGRNTNQIWGKGQSKPWNKGWNKSGKWDKAGNMFESQHSIAANTHPPSPALKALAMLLENRNLLSLISDTSEFRGAEIPGVSLFCAIIGILQRDDGVNVEALQEQLPEEHQNYFKSVIKSNDLKSMASFVPDEGMEAEFLGAIARLKEQAGEQALEFLLGKAKENTLTAEEKAKLRYLIDQKDKNRVD